MLSYQSVLTMKKLLSLYIFLLAPLTLPVFYPAAQAQIFDQVTRPSARIQDTDMIAQILDDLIIPASEDITEVEIIDITGNGYGLDDAVVLYPTLEIFYLETSLTPELEEILSSWELAADFRLQEAVADLTTVGENSSIFSEDVRGLMGIAILQKIGEYYSGENFEMRLSRGTEGIFLEMWNYEESALSIPPAPAPDCGPLRQRWQYSRPMIVRSFRDNSTRRCVVTTISEEGEILQLPCE